MTDASQAAIGAMLQQTREGSPQPLGFFTKKLSATQCRYSTLGQELLAIYEAIRHFRHVLEGHDYTVFTDHKPLIFAVQYPATKLCPREVRQLEFISQFTSDIQHVSGPLNPVADALSRLELDTVEAMPLLSMNQLAAAQQQDDELQRLRATLTNLVLVQRPVPLSMALL